MIRQFFPYEFVDSVFSIDYAALYQKGFRALIFDIDNTLVPHGDDSNVRVDALFQTLQAMGFRTLLLSNNGEARVQRFLKNIDAPYICNADKPNPEGFERAVSMLGCKNGEVVVIGDQVFDDIRGANRCGLASILVRFLRQPNEKRIGKKRRVEQLLLACYTHSRQQYRLGGIERKEAAVV